MTPDPNTPLAHKDRRDSVSRGPCRYRVSSEGRLRCGQRCPNGRALVPQRGL